MVLNREYVFSRLPRRAPESHKGNYGKLLAVCGSSALPRRGGPVHARRAADGRRPVHAGRSGMRHPGRRRSCRGGHAPSSPRRGAAAGDGKTDGLPDRLRPSRQRRHRAHRPRWADARESPRARRRCAVRAVSRPGSSGTRIVPCRSHSASRRDVPAVRRGDRTDHSASRRDGAGVRTADRRGRCSERAPHGDRLRGRRAVQEPHGKRGACARRVGRSARGA